MPFTIPIFRDRIPFRSNRWLQSTVVVFGTVWIISLAGTTDGSNGILENIQTVLFVTFLVVSCKRF